MIELTQRIIDLERQCMNVMALSGITHDALVAAIEKEMGATGAKPDVILERWERWVTYGGGLLELRDGCVYRARR